MRTNRKERFFAYTCYQRTSIFTSLAGLILSSFALPAKSEPQQSQLPASTSDNVHKSVTLDLSSVNRDLPAPGFISKAPVGITEGGIVKQIIPSSLLTPAERVAAWQVFSTGHQSIQLGTDGNAIGGSLTIGNKFAQVIDSINIPQGVTAIAKFSTNDTMAITGNLLNAGSLFATTTNPSLTNLAISANNIINQPSGVISTALPAALLASMNGAVNNLNLTLNAIHDIINSGSILSGGSLTATAGGSIINSAGSGIGNIASPSIISSSNLTLISGMGNFINSGVIASEGGNISFSNSIARDLTINNTKGIIEALNGQIIVQNGAAFDTGLTANLNMSGGDWLSDTLNLNANAGSILADLHNITGVVNSRAIEEHLTVNFGQLRLGDTALSGDPSYFNTGGSVTLSSLSLGQADLAIVASQDILVNGSAGLSTDNANITLIAGAQFTTSPGAPNVQQGPDSSTTLSITGASSTGGSIQVAGPISTSGGRLLAAAYTGDGKGSNYTPGAISLATNSGSTINSNNGDVTLISGASSGTGITVGDIITSGGPRTAGAVTLYAATPVIANGPLTIKDGTITNGSFETDASKLTFTASNMSTKNIQAAGAGGIAGFVTGGNGGPGYNGGSVTIQAGGIILVDGYIRTFGGGGGGGCCYGTVFSNNGGDGGTGGAVSVISQNASVTISGDINTSGGGGGGGAGGGAQVAPPDSFGGSGGSGGSAGSVTVQSSREISIKGPILAAGGGNGGSVPTVLVPLQTAFSIPGAGGGGSFGGGGGGGAGGYSTLIGERTFPPGGGGGGGFYGGGAGAGESDPPFIAGAGGANTQGGAGKGDGSAGSGGSQPNIQGGQGGSFGKGGTGGQLVLQDPFGILPPITLYTAPSGADAGTQASGGAITLSGSSVEVTGNVASLGSAYSSSSYGNYAIINSGGTQPIKITATQSGSKSSLYFEDANYALGANTYRAPLPFLFFSAGDLLSGTDITLAIPGPLAGSYSSPVTPSSFGQSGPNIGIGGQSFTITEGGRQVVITSGSLITPAENLALMQVIAGGSQTLVLSQPAATSTPGTGYASSGSFTVSDINVPIGGFKGLNVPSGVTAVVGTSSKVTYAGTSTIDGLMNFSSASNSVTFDSAVGGPVIYAGLMTVTGTGVLSTANGFELVAGGDINLNGTFDYAFTFGKIQSNVVMMAGADFTISNGNTVTINGASTSGGAIYAPTTISTSGSNLLAVAYSGSGTGSNLQPGSISVGNIDTLKPSNSLANGGSVTIIAGATSGQSLITGSISAPGAGVALLSAVPTFNAITSLNITDGVLSSSTPYVTATSSVVLNHANLSTGDIVSAGRGKFGGVFGSDGGAVSIGAAGDITINGYLRTFGGGGGGGSIITNGGNGGNGGSIFIESQKAISIYGDINTSGGGGGGGAAGFLLNKYIGSNGGLGGNAGNITLLTPGIVFISGPLLAAGGGSGGAGGNGQVGCITCGGGAGGGGGSLGAGGGAGAAQVGGFAGGGGAFFGGGTAVDINGGYGGSYNVGGYSGGKLGAGSNGAALGMGGNGGLPVGTGTTAQPGAAGTAYATGTSLSGTIVISGSAVYIVGTVGTLAAKTGFATSPPPTLAADAINAIGNNGTVLVTYLTGYDPTYFIDANYGPGAHTYAAPLGGFASAGNIEAGTGAGQPISLGGMLYNSPVTAATFGQPGPGFSLGNLSAQITENGAPVTIFPGSLITPAEDIAMVQVLATGTQTLTLAALSGPGSGYATAGSFNVNANNIPVENFSTLVLPQGTAGQPVTMNVNVPTLKYTGDAYVGGVVSLTSPNTVLTVRGSTVISGSVSFTGGGTSTLSSGGSISGAGNINSPQSLTLNTIYGSIFGASASSAFSVQTPSLAISVGGSSSSAFLSDNQSVTLNTSNAANILSLSSAGSIAINGDVNSMSPGALILLSTTGNSSAITETNTGGTLYAAALTLTTVNGNIGVLNSPVVTNTKLLSLNAGGQGSNAFVANNQAVSLSDSHAAGTLSLTNAGTITLAGNVNLQTLPGSNIILNATRTTSNIQQGPSNSKLYASNISLATTDGDIGGADNNSAIFTSATALSANAGGAQRNVSLFNDQPVTLNASSAANAFAIANVGDITINGDINSQKNPAKLVFLFVVGKGNIFEGSNSGRLYASTLAMLAPDGSIGGGAAGAMLTSTPSLFLAAAGTAGNATLLNDQPIALTLTQASGVLNITANGDITIAASVNSKTAPGKGITLSATTGSIVEGTTSGLLYANSVSLLTTNGNIGSSALGGEIDTSTANLSAIAGGINNSALLTNDQNLTLGVSSAGGTFSLANRGHLTIARSINSPASRGSVVSLQTTAGSTGTIDLGDNISADNISIVADGALQHGAGTIYGAAASLMSRSADIGTGSPGAMQNIFVSCLGPVTLAAPLGSIALTSIGDLQLANVSTQTNGHVQIATQSNGSITLLNGFTVQGSSGRIDLLAGGTGSIIQGPGNASPIAADSIIFGADSGDIGTVAKPILTATANLEARGGANIQLANMGNVMLKGADAGGKFSLTDTGSVTVAGDVLATSGVDVQAANSLSVATKTNVYVYNGSVTLVAGVASGPGATGLTLGAGAALSSTEGNVTLQNQNTLSGFITIGFSSSVTAVTAGGSTGQVLVYMGKSPTFNNSQPAPSQNITPDVTNGGFILWGSGTQASISAMPPSNKLVSNAGLISFETNSARPSVITLGGGTTITSIRSQPPAPPLGSLDLTNQNIITQLITLQNNHSVIGSLQNPSPGVVFGSVTLHPENLTNTIAAMNIPAAVTLTFSNFGSARPVSVSINSGSVPQALIIDGTVQFSGASTSTSKLAVTSGLALSAPIFQIGNAGALSSTGGLIISANGDSSVSGPVNASSLVLAAGAGSNGQILLNNNITAKNTASFIADGIGNIILSPGFLLTSPNLVLRSSSGDIGSRLTPLVSAASNISANTLGSTFLTNVGAPVNLLSASAGNQQTFQLINQTNGISLFTDIASPAGTIQTIRLFAGSGSITGTPSTNLAAANYELYAGGGSIGAPLLGTLAPLNLASGSLTIIAGTSSNIASNGALAINSSYGGTSMTLAAAGGLSVNDNASLIAVSTSITTPSVTLGQSAAIITSDKLAIVSPAQDLLVTAISGAAPALSTSTLVGLGGITLSAGANHDITLSGTNAAIQTSLNFVGPTAWSTSGTGAVNVSPSTIINVTGGNGAITVRSPAGQGLTISGGGSVMTSAVNLTSGTSGNGNLQFAGSQAFNSGLTTLSALTGQLIIAPGANIAGKGAFVLNSPNPIIAPPGYQFPAVFVVNSVPPFNVPGGNGSALTVTTSTFNNQGSIVASAPPPPMPTPNSMAALSHAGTPFSPFAKLAVTPNLTFFDGLGATLSTEQQTAKLAANVQYFSEEEPTVDGPQDGRPDQRDSSPMAFLNGNIVFTPNVLSNLLSMGFKVGAASKNEFLDLLQGRLILAPEHYLEVKTQECIVEVFPGAVVFIIETGNDAAVMNLHDTHDQSVRVRIGSHKISVSPGKQLVMTRKRGASFSEIEPSGGIAYRNEKLIGTADGVIIHSADFSAVSLLNHLYSLKTFNRSDSTHMKTMRRVLKTSAISTLISPKVPFHANAKRATP